MVSLHGLAAVAVAYVELSLIHTAALHGTLLCSLLWQWYRYGSECSHGFVTHLRVDDEGGWQWVYADGTVRQQTLKRYYIHAHLLILQFHGPLPGGNQTLVIAADATDSESLRQLRCYLFRLAWQAQT